MKKTFLLSILLMALMMVPFAGDIAAKEAAKTINYTGNLFDYQGNAINRSVAMTFKIYNSENGGSTLWTEPHYNVPVTNGYFSVSLGSETPLNLPFTEKYWVEVEVDGNKYPRVQFSSVPSAFVSLRAFKADTSDVAKALEPKSLTVDMMSDAARTVTGDIEGTYPNLMIKDGVIVGKLGQGVITNYHLSPSVTTPPSGPAGGALTGQYPNPKLAENAVETHIIADGAVTYGKVQDAMGDAGTILVWNGNAWVESMVSDWEIDGVIGNEVNWASAGLEILNDEDGALGVGIMEGGVTNDMLAGDITGDKFADATIPMDKFENGDVHGQIMWWDNTAKAWRMTKAKPAENYVLKFQYDADETAYNVAWGMDGMNIPFAYMGSSINENNVSQTMLSLTLDGTQTTGTGNDIHGIAVTIDDTKAGSAIVAKGSGLVVVPGTDYLAPVVKVDGQTTIQSGAYTEGILSVYGSINQADNLTMGAVVKQEIFGSTNGYETIGLDVENRAGYVEDGGMVIGLDLSTYTEGGDGTGTVLGVDAGVEAFGAELAFGVSGVASGANKNVGVFGGVNVDDKTFTDIYANMPAHVDHIGVMAYADIASDELAFYAYGDSEFDGNIFVNGNVEIDGDIDATTGTIVTLDGIDLDYTNGTITNLTSTTGAIATLTGNMLTYNTGAIATLTGNTATYTTLNSTTHNNSGLITTANLTATGNVTTNTLNATTGAIATLTGNSLTYTTGAIATLTGTTATYGTVNSTTLNNSGMINTLNLTATDNVTTNTLNATTGTIATLTGTTATYTTLNSTSLNNSGLITTANLTASGNITTNTLNATTGTIETLTGTTANYTTVNSGTINNTGMINTLNLKATGDIDALTGTIATLDGTSLAYTTGAITTLTGNSLTYTTGAIATLTGTTATYTTVNSGTINNTGMINTLNLKATGDVEALTGTITTIDGTNLMYTNGTFTDLTVNDDLVVNDATTLNGLVTINNNVDMTGNLLLDGDAVITGLLVTEDFEATTAVIDDLTVTTIASIKALDVIDNATIGGNLAVTGTVTVDDVATFNAEAIFDNAITINDNTPVNAWVGIAGTPGPGNDGDVFVSRGAGLSPEWSNRLEALEIVDLYTTKLVIDLEDGAAPLVQAPAVGRSVDFGAVGMGNGCDVNIYGELLVNTLSVVDPIAYLEVVDLDVTHFLNVSGDAAITGELNVNDIYANYIECNTTVKTSDLTVDTDAAIAQDLTVGGSLEVTGLSTFRSDVTVNNSSDLNIPTGDLNAGQNIDVFGGIRNTSVSGMTQQPVTVDDPQGLNVVAGVTAHSLTLSTATVAVLGDLATATASIINFTAGVNVTTQVQLPAGTDGRLFYIVNGSGVNISILGSNVNAGNLATLVYISGAWRVIP